MRSYPGFVLRTVRNGRVRFDHQWWKPDEPTNRLDGKRFAFGVYVEGAYSHPVRRLDILDLWGSEAAYKSVNDDELYQRLCEEDSKLLAPDGYFRQGWWRPMEKA